MPTPKKRRLKHWTCDFFPEVGDCEPKGRVDSVGVSPPTGEINMGSNFIFNVDVEGEDFYALEIDHSMAEQIPEFTVYADSDDPYGGDEYRQDFENLGASVTYNNGIWSIDFGTNLTDIVKGNGGITIYAVIRNQEGQVIWGSMSPPTPENTFVYTHVADQ